MKREILAKVQRAHSAEATRERLKTYNAGQTYVGKCRFCKAPWSGKLVDAALPCAFCGKPE